MSTRDRVEKFVVFPLALVHRAISPLHRAVALPLVWIQQHVALLFVLEAPAADAVIPAPVARNVAAALIGRTSLVRSNHPFALTAPPAVIYISG